jgi:hypothetical protein
MMTSDMTVFDQLVQIAAAKAPVGYLRAYRNDLFEHDRNALDAPKSDRYIWILRECGTELFPVAIGHDAIWATYWLTQGNSRDVPSLAYLVTLATAKVEPVTYERAECLAREAHPQGKRHNASLCNSLVSWDGESR